MIHFSPQIAGAFSHASRTIPTRPTTSAMPSYVAGPAVGPDGDRPRHRLTRCRGIGSRWRERPGTAGSRSPGPGCRPHLARRGTPTRDPRLGSTDGGVRPGPPRSRPRGATGHPGPRRGTRPCLLRRQGRRPRSRLDRTRQHRRSPSAHHIRTGTRDSEEGRRGGAGRHRRRRGTHGLPLPGALPALGPTPSQHLPGPALPAAPRSTPPRPFTPAPGQRRTGGTTDVGGAVLTWCLGAASRLAWPDVAPS